MARENLELVRSLFEAWNGGDYSSVDWADPEIEYVIADGPAPGRWAGRAGLAQGWRGILSAWDQFGADVDDYRALDDERVLVLVRRRGRGKTSGLELGRMRSEGAVLLHVRGDKVTRLVHYWDRERALADLGLAPEAGTQRS